MNTGMKITVLADNTAAVEGTREEHGLAFRVGTAQNCLLFDTGQGLALAENARVLHLDLDAVDTIVLSHGHYDHTGGVAEVLRRAAGPVAVHAHPDAFLPKYRRGNTGTRAIGIPAESREAMLNPRCRVVLSRQPVEIAPGIRTTGEIPRRHPEEAPDESFCRDAEGRETDLLPDDQALCIQTASGTVVLLGCAHAGVVNTLDHIQQLTDGRPIRAVIGGMHLRSATEERIRWTMGELRRFQVPLLAPMHCTGSKAVAALGTAFLGAVQTCGAGSAFEF